MIKPCQTLLMPFLFSKIWLKLLKYLLSHESGSQRYETTMLSTTNQRRVLICVNQSESGLARLVLLLHHDPDWRHGWAGVDLVHVDRVCRGDTGVTQTWVSSSSSIKTESGHWFRFGWGCRVVRERRGLFVSRSHSCVPLLNLLSTGDVTRHCALTWLGVGWLGGCGRSAPVTLEVRCWRGELWSW